MMWLYSISYYPFMFHWDPLGCSQNISRGDSPRVGHPTSTGPGQIGEIPGRGGGVATRRMDFFIVVTIWVILYGLVNGCE